MHFGTFEFARQRNLHALKAGLEFAIGEEAQAAITAYNFWLDQDDDQWHGRYQRFAGQRVNRDAKNHLGTELALRVAFPIRIGERRMTATLGYSHFFTGSFVPDAGDADLGFLMLQHAF